MPDVLKAQSNDIMGRIEQIAACGIPRELLILLSSGLFEAGKAAQRAGAPTASSRTGAMNACSPER